jgi:hypothetical protein
MPEEAKKKYDALMREYSLPDFEELDREFDIGKLETESFALKEVRRKIAEKIEFFCKLLEEVLQPDTNISNLYESKYFNDNEKKEVFDAYKKVMRLHRETAELAIKNDEGEDAGFIKKIFVEMPALKNELLPIVVKLKQSWEKETEEGEKLRYLG